MNKISRANLVGKWSCLLVIFCGLISSQAQTNINQSSTTNRPPAPRRPSIVLIFADNVGYGDLGCYGQTKVKTPNLDRLAGEGIRFTSYYAGSPRDEASRASLLTGFEPRHIDSSFSHPLPMGALTVAAVLREMGYRTGYMGEWNLGDTAPVEPNTKGFEEFAGYLSQAHARDYFSDSLYRQQTTSGSNRLVTVADNWDNARGRYTPDMVGQMGSSFIKIYAPTRFNDHQAFFLALGYPVPHNSTPPKKSPYANESWPQPEKDRAAMIAHLDESVGHVLAELTVNLADTNTIVIFTSVGGAQLEGAMDPKFFNSSGPLRGEAGSVYEGGIRAPMIIRWPARIKPGQVSDVPWAAWDILPTAAEIAFMKAPEKIDGISILPLLTGKGKMKPHESFYWETHNDDGLQQAVRMEDWKLVRIGTNAPALYNLKTDIGEKDDQAAGNPDLVKKMTSLLSAPAN